LGLCSLTASVTAGTNYASATGSAQTFTIGKATPTITIANLPSSGAYGGSFTPSDTYNGNGTASVTSNSTGICTVVSGVVHYAGVGTCSLTASATAGTNYLAAPGSAQTFSIGQATPTITWATPAAILYPAALSATQLDANANVLGTYAYSPASGTVPNPGTNTLSVTFTPQDAVDYTTATATTQLTVNQLAALASPTPGTTLSGSSATFTWTVGSGVTQYELWLGTTGAGSMNVLSLTTTAHSSGVVSSIPTIGATLYARLYSMINGAWQYIDYTYTEAGAAVPAAMISPTPGSTLTGSSTTFNWTTGSSVTQYQIMVGTTGAGTSNLLRLTTTALSSGQVNNIPITGGTLYVRLYSMIAGAWQYTDYTYTEK
jgi:hypothetical protein